MTITLLKLLSLCLAYPDPAFVEALPEMKAAAAGLSDPLARERLLDFMARLEKQPLLALQEHYTAVFDLNPSASLNLTYHLMGDREERGPALAELLDIYGRAGFEPAVNELPDYLPLLLEFLSASPQSESNALVRRCLTAVPAIAGRLKQGGSMFAAPLELLCGVFPEILIVPE
jgi:nitrate reductase molybdenum cofactor assembly chaperone NarJ/NarW